jgi:ABC-type polysaccharide/polyol phosphate transport system ATPase subunit
VRKGEIVGIIGENGSGKSTLLRVIAGIYRQDEGKIITNGKIISLINLRVGLQDRLTMKDNIFLVSSFFGATENYLNIN